MAKWISGKRLRSYHLSREQLDALEALDMRWSHTVAWTPALLRDHRAPARALWWSSSVPTPRPCRRLPRHTADPQPDC